MTSTTKYLLIANYKKGSRKDMPIFGQRYAKIVSVLILEAEV